MRNPTFLALSRHGIFYFRWPVPRSLHPLRRPSSIKVSLQTHDPSAALRLARMLSFSADRFVASGALQRMSYEEIRRVVAKHFAALLAQRKSRILEFGRLTGDEIATYEGNAASAEEALSSGQPLKPFNDDAKIMAALIERYQLTASPGSNAYRTLRTEFMRGYAAFCKSLLAADRSLDTFDLEASEPLSDFLQSPKSMSLRELTESYQQEKKRGGMWTEKTAGERASHLSLLQEILGGGTEVGSLTSREAIRVKATLQRYPKNRNKNPATRGLSLTKALAVPGIDTLDVVTSNKHLRTFHNLFKWAKQNGHVGSVLFDGMAVERKATEDDNKLGYELPEVQTLLDELLTNKRGLIRKPYQKWGPLIAAYTGARLSEVAQLEPKDVKEEGPVPYFDLNTIGDRKRVKNANSIRHVPIHARLFEHGLREFVTERRLAGATKLLPDQSYDRPNGWGRSLGRWANNILLPELGLKSERHTFHSLRHTVITHLARQKVEWPMVQAIVGHKGKGVTQGYFGLGYTIEQKSEALHKLPF